MCTCISIYIHIGSYGDDIRFLTQIMDNLMETNMEMQWKLSFISIYIYIYIGI